MSRRLVHGLYDLVVSWRLDEELRGSDIGLATREPIESDESADALVRLLADPVRRTFAATRNNPEAQSLLCERILALLADTERSAAEVLDAPHIPFERLLAISPQGLPGEVTVPERTEIPLGQSALLVNARDQPRIGTELGREMASSDRIDLLCAFLKWEGFRVLESAIESFQRRGGRFRVLTTTYIGATDRRVLDRLAELGVETRVCYETGRTRLHAKAWLFERQTGFHTGYVGSSNLSRAALLDGLEWNVRLTALEQPHLLDTFRATFEEYWNDQRFESYDPARDAKRFDEAIQRERGGSDMRPFELSGLQVIPWPHQRRMLEQLEVERSVHDHHENLVVSATGTGKTILAALDFERLSRAGQVGTILFIAHRQEILDQSMRAFREVLRQGDFGELFVAGDRPEQWRHVFASIQSLHRVDLDAVARDRFDMIVVDEFHHAEAPTYERWLRHLKPRELLGLTATPERADGQDVKHWFGGRTAVELRLWEALEEGLLCPFQYFGLNDGTDLREVRWSRGRYDTADLSRVLSAHDLRARLVLEQLGQKVHDPLAMRALGFCVSVDHAKFMARFFTEQGVPALAVSGETGEDDRRNSLRRLRDREVNVLFSVDLFNEGLDLPEVDTVLLLRPTESATIFLQQLGRGLRLAPEKCCLTVLDFIGQQHARFRFDLKYRALIPGSRRELEREINAGFPRLPAGCHLELDRVATGYVLENLRNALGAQWRGLVTELRHLGDIPLRTYLDETGVELEDLYRGKGRGWTALRREAGHLATPPGPEDAKLAAGISRVLHLDDAERLAFFRRIVTGETTISTERERRLNAMLQFDLWGSAADPAAMESGLAQIAQGSDRRSELLEVFELLMDRIPRATLPIAFEDLPLRVHASYRRDEIVAAFGRSNPSTLRQGVCRVEKDNADFFLVTLRKNERHFSPSTRYQDRAVSHNLFQWESQSTTSDASPTGQRYIHHLGRGSSIHLFVRIDRKTDSGAAQPFIYLGTARYQSHTGELPMRILWQLDYPMPEEIFEQYRLAAA